jgi:spore maturation protein A
MNFSANLFGLGFAATPSGLLGMKRLSEISEIDKSVASDDMVTFLVLNTAGVTLVPTTVLALRDSLGSVNPADFMLIGLIGTLLSCVGGVVIERLLRRPYQ